MAGNRRLSALLCGCLSLATLCVAAQEPPPQATPEGQVAEVPADEPKASPAPAATVMVTPSEPADEPNLPPPPSFTNSQSPCTALPARSPHLAMTAKTKTGERYYRVSLGCVPFTLEGELLDEKSQAALDEAVGFVLGREDVVRIYIDMATFGMDDPELETRFRQQAFAVKKYLTHKGVYSHVKDSREDKFPPYFEDEKERLKAKLAAQAPKPSPAPKASTQPKKPAKDLSRDYTFAVNRGAMLYYEDEPLLYRKDPRGGFQFVPLDSIYFPHDGDALNDRAKATLDVIAEYVQRHPEADRLIVRGNADETGSKGYNYRLTDRRAEAVRQYLLERGVSTVLVESLSAGESDPVDENWTRQGKARNRRVELYLVQRVPTPISQFSQPQDLSDPSQDSSAQTPIP